MNTESSSRAETIRRWFGLRSTRPAWRESECASDPPLPRPGQIFLITGPSGSGKSTLLRRCRRAIPPPHRIDLDRLRLPSRSIIDLFPALPVEPALHLLSRFGLAEAHTYLLKPCQLSTGQRWRLRLALACAQAELTSTIVCDEFTALLDRVTAAIISHAFRRVIDDRPHLSAILTTSHADLMSSLRPDRHWVCNFDAEPE